MSQLVDVWRGCVAAWECDEMGHMNVRRYVERSLDGLDALGLSLGFGPRRLDAMQVAFVPREHHMRFLRELLPGTPCVLRSGVLQVEERNLSVYQELVRSSDEQVCATFRLEVEFAKDPGWRPEPLSGELRARANNLLVPLPEYAKPRGLSLDPPRPTPSVQEAIDLDMLETYRGVVHKEDTDLLCRMQLWSHMARLSDAVPSLFEQTDEELSLRPGDGRGAAAVEYRLVYRVSPILGDILAVRSGLKAQREASSHLCHWVFHAETGECLCSAECVVVLLDLATRKPIRLTPEARHRVAERAIASLTL